MVFATPSSNHTSKQKSNSKNTYQIGGLKVEFPYQPYGTQLSFMCRVVSTLDRAHQDGRCHALLESPTGTGKSLSLLCSVLAWQKNYKIKNQNVNLSHSKAAPEAMTDPLARGGGFVPESQPSSIPPSGNPDPVQDAKKKSSKNKLAPTIYYSSRTHSQISQVVREYRKTTYRVPMAVLASRKHYCTNRHLRGKENLDEECKLLLKDKKNIQCSEFKNVHKVVGHPSLQKGGCHEVHDIEDLVKVGQNVKGCSYYAARTLAESAQLVFCPYNYIINPVIRGAMEVDVKGAILIFDEAHNMEDIARDAGSMDIEEDVLLKLQSEIEQLSLVDAGIYQPLCEMTQGLISWIEQKKSTLEKLEFQHHFSCWTGNKAMKELEEANISQQCFPILLECAIKAIKAATDLESDVPRLSGMSVTILEGLFSSLTYFFSRNGSHIFDYQLGLQKYIKKDAKNASGNWTHTLSLWCLNPAVVFRDLADLSMSIILTSGTLSPMNSFSSELGVQFGTCLEAPHVIDIESQVWVASIASGPSNYPLNASYKTADAFEFQDALGKSLEEICKVVKGGSLVFFPSYKLMDKLCSRWRKTGQWSRLNLKKSLFVEPRGGSQDEFEPVLKGYYDSIKGGNKPAFVRKRRATKTQTEVTEKQENKKDGATFLAVCRGKVSEGIDFSDDNARVVIVVGIPFPNINDIQVGLKRKYNDTYKSSKNLLSGSEWYCNQAFRALNQAAGRCIRHKSDYGAIILLDERYREERNKKYISKWLRQCIRQYDDFDMSLEDLRSFFRDVKDRIAKKNVSCQDGDIVEENFLFTNQSEGAPSKKNGTMDKSDNIGQKDWIRKSILGLRENNRSPAEITLLNQSKRLSKSKQKNQKLDKFYDPQSKEFLTVEYDSKSQGDVIPVQASLQADQDVKNCKEHIDMDCSFQMDSRCCQTSSMTFSGEDEDVSFLKETLCTVGDTFPSTHHYSSKNRSYSPTVVQATADSPDPPHVSSTKSIVDPSNYESSTIVTPDKNVNGFTFNLIPEIESSLNLSVNSHACKRRKSPGFPFSDPMNEETNFHASIPPDRMSLTRKIEFGSEPNSVELKPNSSNLSQMNGLNINSAPGLVREDKLKISCSLCRSPLGLPENHLYLNCMLTSSSKAHLASLFKKSIEAGATTTSILTSTSVLITDSSSVNHRLCSRTTQGAESEGIWCEQDGCVFNNVYCPFCTGTSNCLGVHVMATDASNLELLNKVLFYVGRLEIEDPEVTKDKEIDHKDLRPVCGTRADKSKIFRAIDQFAYSPPQLDSGGWRTTKSKLKLPKKS